MCGGDASAFEAVKPVAMAFSRAFTLLGGPGSGPVLEPLRIGMLPEKVRNVVVKLPVNRVSQPIDIPGAKLFAIVCQRQDDSGLPSEDQIYAKLEGDKLENVARQRLRDLRRQALIDVRL